MTGNIRLRIATADHDHVREFRLGLVRAEGIDTTWLMMDFHEIFARFLANREWEVSELSFAKFVAEATRPDADIIGLPVFLRRAFRFGFIFVNRTKGIKGPEDLRGRKIGLPEWAQTATVYMRGWLQEDVGVPLGEVDWYQAGINEIGRHELVEMRLPGGIRLTRVADKTLSDMLSSGELDCIFAATPPKALGRHPDVVRLFPETRAMDEAFLAKHRAYPIMHVIALRKDILRDDPWIARNLFLAFEEAKRRSVARIKAGLDFPIPWLAEHATMVAGKFGGDFFPYGIEANRTTLEMFLRYAYDQGVAHRHAQPEDLFPKGIMVEAKI